MIQNTFANKKYNIRVENYMNKNAGEGGQGKQYKREPITPSYNRMKFPKF